MPKPAERPELPLTHLNQLARQEQMRNETLEAQFARRAMEAIARAFPGAPSVDEVLAGVKAEAQKGKK